jgi:hypothetical protein
MECELRMEPADPTLVASAHYGFTNEPSVIVCACSFGFLLFLTVSGNRLTFRLARDRLGHVDMSASISPSGGGARKDGKTSQHAPSDLTDFHGAPPLAITLARKANGKMTGKLLFGNIGREARRK